MARMIDMIRQSAVPANVMRSAAKGALALPPEEMVEILVFLTTNPLFADAARMTLAGWDEKASIRVAQNPQTPPEVLVYWVDLKNLRPRLLPALLENPAVAEGNLLELAKTPSRELVDTMLRSSRVQKSSALLHALLANPHLSAAESAVAHAALEMLPSGGLQELTPVEEALLPAPSAPIATPTSATAPALAPILASVPQAAPALAPAPESLTEIATGLTPLNDHEKTEWEIEHAAEIAAEEGKAFELIGGIEGLKEEPLVPVADDGPIPIAPEAEKERVSIVQKISRLTVGQRVQLAMKGNKEERAMLIRDGAKLVASAVLVSPKVTSAEVETFAAMKNVQEQVLRDIARTPKFRKMYTVTRNLTNNPRCPLDLSLQLVNHLMAADLKNLSMNKNVPDTLRKVAHKKFKEKT